jgi:hypothetical protein
MPYNLHMSAAQIARCNRALGSDQLSTTRIIHTGGGVATEHEVVQLSAPGIREVIDALRARPEPCDTAEPDVGADLDQFNLAYLASTLELVLEDEEDPEMLFGVCL